MNHQVKKSTIPVKGMHCASCGNIIERTLKKVEGVESVEVNIATEKAKIVYDASKINLKELSEKVELYGYSFAFQEHRKDHTKHHVETESHDHEQYGGIDHSEHIGLHQSKEDKLVELKQQREKVEFVLPITFFVFFAMMWEILAKSFDAFPRFFLPMELYNIIAFMLGTIVMFWTGKPFIEGFIKFLKYRVANMDTLVGIGTLTAYFYSTIVVLLPQVSSLLNLPETTYFDVTIVVIGFITLGKYLESSSKIKTGEAIEKLLNLQAKTALIERVESEEVITLEIPIDQVVSGDIVIVKPGGKVPVDGTIIEGSSSIDESMISGEPIPVDKGAGDTVIGGTINKQGTFKFTANKVGSETLLAQIIKMVEEAQGSRAPIQKLADQISAVFVPVVLVVAFLTLVAWTFIGAQFMPITDAFSLGLVCFVGILVIACPCALGLATPTAVIVGVGKGATNGILIKNAESLEKLHKVNVVVVDKTGTITKGKPELIEINILQNSKIKTRKEILQVISSLERNSEHPLAEAVVKKANEESIEFLPVEGFESIQGKGLKGKVKIINEKLDIYETFYAGNLKLIEDLGIDFDRNMLEELTAKGKTPVILATQKEVLALIAIADTIKDTAIDAVKALHKQGIRVAMLTGDNQNTAQYIADQAGIDEVFAEVLPQDKAAKIIELQQKGLTVAMAGDGVNDAPALAQADVGIAMGTGTDVAIESADITLLGGDISKLAQSIKLSKMTMRTIKQNLFWAFIYNIIGIPIAAGVLYPVFGWLLNPIFAGLAMAFSSVSVVTNSLRLKGDKL